MIGLPTVDNGSGNPHKPRLGNRGHCVSGCGDQRTNFNVGNTRGGTVGVWTTVFHHRGTSKHLRPGGLVPPRIAEVENPGNKIEKIWQQTDQTLIHSRINQAHQPTHPPTNPTLSGGWFQSNPSLKWSLLDPAATARAQRNANSNSLRRKSWGGRDDQGGQWC